MLVEATSVKTVADRVFNLLKGYGFQIDTTIKWVKLLVTLQMQ